MADIVVVLVVIGRSVTIAEVVDGVTSGGDDEVFDVEI